MPYITTPYGVQFVPDYQMQQYPYNQQQANYQQNTNYQQNMGCQQNQPQQQTNMLTGRYVQNQAEIKANEIPADGSIGYYPLADHSAIRTTAADPRHGASRKLDRYGRIYLQSDCRLWRDDVQYSIRLHRHQSNQAGSGSPELYPL